MRRVPPSERTKEMIGELLREGCGEESPRAALSRLAIRRVVEEALEGAVRDIVGREYYGRRQGEAQGYRNGYREGRLKSSEGEVRYASPQVRDVEEPGTEKLRALRKHLRGRTQALEELVLEMYARGCSTRDIEDLFRGEDGKSLVSRSAVSEVTAELWKEYEQFATRRLDDLKPLYLFLDGIAERLRPGSKREAVLCAWAITWEGKKVLVHLLPGTKESTQCCRDFLQDLKRRGLDDPVLVVTDGAAGLIRAVEECFATSLRQRCLVHKMRNLMSKVPEQIQAEFKEAARGAYQAASPALAEVLRSNLVEQFESTCPTAVRIFEEDFEACVAHLRCPPNHRRVVRTTNLLERLFREERRRTRATCNFFGEKPVLKLMYAAVIRASDRWNGVQITEHELKQLERLRETLLEEHRRATAPVVSQPELRVARGER